MTNIKGCEWCACIGCSEGNCCSHGEYTESGRWNPRQPHRLVVRVVSGEQNAIGGNFVVEDEFGNVYRWEINEVNDDRYRGIPTVMARRLKDLEQNIFDIYPLKADLTRVFSDPL